MEQTNKRTRDDSQNEEVDSPASKLTRVDSVASDTDSAESKRIQEDLLDILNDSDDRDPAIQGLDSVIRSFEEEIQVPEGTVHGQCSESQPDLGFLQEASDDELGLPPSSSSSEVQKAQAVGSDFSVYTASGFSEILEFYQVPSFDSFEFGFDGGSDNNINYNDSADFVALGGLFDYAEGADVSEIPWRRDSLSAL